MKTSFLFVTIIAKGSCLTSLHGYTTSVRIGLWWKFVCDIYLFLSEQHCCSQKIVKVLQSIESIWKHMKGYESVWQGIRAYKSVRKHIQTYDSVWKRIKVYKNV